MSTLDYSALDRLEVSMKSFYPRSFWTPTPAGAEDHTVAVAEGISLSCRFFPAGLAHPTVLFFYGNGETVADYNNIAPLYQQLGVNFFVADYRGYGASGGLPTFTAMLSDSHKILDYLKSVLADVGYTGQTYVMGRSMGRHPAFELGAHRSEDLAGVIIESGRPNLGQFAHGLSDAQAFETDYRNKVRSITLPALVIHGEWDELAPVQQAVEMYHGFPSPDKRLLTIPGAGHNDLLYRGMKGYFPAIGEFVGSRAELEGHIQPGATP